MPSAYPRVRVPGPVKYTSWTPETGEVEHFADRLIARDLVRIVFFVPRDNFDITAGVSHALDSYVRAVNGCPGALAEYTCCYWEPSRLAERGWELIRETLNPTERRHADDYTREEAFHPLKDGADPYFGIYGEQDSGFSFQYHARIPWREAPPGRASVLRVTLPTEYLEERGAGFVREFTLDMVSRLPFASGHAGLALEYWYAVPQRLDVLRPVMARYPGFDIRNANIHSRMGTQVDGVHWLNFLGQPVLGEVGGAKGLRARLQSPSTDVRELDGERVLVTLGPEPEAGNLLHGQNLPAYRELARVLEPYLEPFPWRLTHFTDSSAEEELRRWWRRFLD